MTAKKRVSYVLDAKAECANISVYSVLPDFSCPITVPAAKPDAGMIISVDFAAVPVCCDLRLGNGWFTEIVISVKSVCKAAVRRVRKIFCGAVRLLQMPSIIRRPVCLRL